MKPPAFVGKRGYRRRRVLDAIRLLPVLGVLAFLLPLLWQSGTTRAAMVYVFASWILLILLAWFFSRRVDDAGQDGRGPDDRSGGA